MTSLLFQMDEIVAQPGPAGGVLIVTLIVALLLALVNFASWWRIFAKADYPGWLAIIPVVNVLTLLHMLDKPWWWLLLLFVPFVNIVIIIILFEELAHAFGQGTGFAVGLFFLTLIFAALLGFGDYQYRSQPLETLAAEPA